MNEAAMEDAAGTIHIVDAQAGSTANTVCNTGGSSMIALRHERTTDLFKSASTAKVSYRHFAGFNALYGDGHVKWRQWGSTRPGDWSVQAND